MTLDGQRCRLRGMMEMGLSIGEIGQPLGRHRSDDLARIARNGWPVTATGRRVPSAGLGAQAARLEDRALHSPARPCRGSPCHGMVA